MLTCLSCRDEHEFVIGYNVVTTTKAVCPICRKRRSLFIRLMPGQQVIYVPQHADGDIDHPDCEKGFVTSIRDDDAFCRYWHKTCPDELRTKANSERTPAYYLYTVDTRPQEDVYRQMRKIDPELPPFELAGRFAILGIDKRGESVQWIYTNKGGSNDRKKGTAIVSRHHRYVEW